MQNKFLSLLVICISFFVFITVKGTAFSQNTATSPYSSYGFGQRDGLDHGVFAGLGTTTITDFDSTTLNFFNPSTYNTIGKGQPLFSTGISSRLSMYSEGNLENFSKAILVNHFAMGLSFAKHFGLAFGLKPFSRRGYQFSTRELLVTDSVENTYLGSGSASEVFLGLSSNLYKSNKLQLSIGGNVGYVFGKLLNERRSNFVGSTYGGIEQKTLKINALHYEVGMFYNQKLNGKHSYTVSAVIEPSQNFMANQQSDLYYSTIVNNPNYYIKLDSSISNNGSLTIAPSSTFGINYIFSFKDLKKESQSRNSEISLHSSYNVTSWSNYHTTFSNTILNPGYSNTNKFTIGIQYIPETSFLGQSAKSNFFETIRFRAGYYQYTLPIKVENLSLTDVGATFGIGIPIRVQKSLSSVNFGFTVGKRGNGTSTSLNEKYLGINMSVVFAPANFERWFIKRKLD